MSEIDPTSAGGGAVATPGDPEAAGAPSAAPVNGNGHAPPGAMTADDPAAMAALLPPAELVEPTALGDLDQAAVEAVGTELAPLPFPPLPLPLGKRAVTGRYRSAGTPFQVELRVDVDGPRPTKRVSADYYAIGGATTTYFGSMRVDAATVTVTPSTITITGVGSFTWAAGAPKVKVVIPRVVFPLPPGSALLQHQTTAGAPGAAYVCRFTSRFLREVLLEQDRQDTVPAPFVSYDTGALPSGGAARTLSVISAYQEAGIGMLSSGTTDVVDTTEAGAGGSWSDAELHAAMVRHFSLWRDVPQWAVWLFHARLHDIGPTLLGIMFDQVGRQRQGAAVFYAGLDGTTPEQRRLQLYTCTHELGHCFNLLHSWQKSLASPPGVDRPASLSWMNYPWRFPGGPAAFWSGFGFQFDDQELVHIRHAFRDDVIMGGAPFGVGSALENDVGWRTPEEDRSGLALELSAPAVFPLGAPVSVELRLSATDARGARATSTLRPRTGAVEIAIRKPNAQVVVYEPFVQHCVSDKLIAIEPQTPISEGAFIGYGRDGLYFAEPGIYELRARYVAPDGSTVLSNVARLRIRAPLTDADDAVADLCLGDEQGRLFALVGSDLPELSRGNDALREVVERYGDHPLAAYARIVLGTNEAREFKLVGPDNQIDVRKPRPEEAEQLLTPVLDVAAVRAPAERVEAPDAKLREGAAALRRMADEPTSEFAPHVAAYIRARRREIAAEVAVPE